MERKWFQRSYRRNLVDIHISDWDERFLSKFDPKEYVDMMALAGVTGVMMYSSSCIGHCNYPTKVGHMHRGLKGRDILGEVINLCHQRGLDVIMYYLVVDTKCGYEDPPDWRMIDAEGKETDEGSRYGCRCINSPYRDFALAQIEELCRNYEFEGIFIDMILWPVRPETGIGVCYCPYCRKRYAKEVGGEPPKIINWQDPKWVRFQRKREEWLEEFVCLVTSTIKKLKPEASVELNSSVYPSCGWLPGVTERLARHNDYLGGDFYGGHTEQSFVCKLFYNLTENMPFEFMTSRCSNLRDHTTMKSKELLKAQVYSALANNGAFLFIDAIDPVGTLSKDVYKELGEVFGETKGYEKYLGGKLCQDFAVYFSFESKISFEDNGKKVTEASLSTPRGPICATKSLLNEHIPFGVITKKNLKDLSSYQVIILPNLLMIDEEEVKALKKFVNSGGNLYASKYTSLLTKDGEKKSDFLLSDLFGVSYVGETKEEATYISPTKEGKDIFLPYSAEYPLTIFGSQVKVKAKKGAKVLATVTLPYTDPKDVHRFASIHSNPPGISTDYPSVVLNEYGKGKVLYVAADLEAAKQEPHRLVFTNLIKMFSSKPLSFETDAPKSVEITLFHQEEKKRYLVNLLNFQAELPNIPVEGIKLRIRLDKKEPKKLINLPEEKELAYESKKGYVEFISPRLETFLMLALDYR